MDESGRPAEQLDGPDVVDELLQGGLTGVSCGLPLASDLLQPKVSAGDKCVRKTATRLDSDLAEPVVDCTRVRSVACIRRWLLNETNWAR